MIPSLLSITSMPPYVWCFFSWPGYAVVVVGLLSQPTEATLAVRESQLREPGK